jgi:hypothetical protein
MTAQQAAFNGIYNALPETRVEIRPGGVAGRVITRAISPALRNMTIETDTGRANQVSARVHCYEEDVPGIKRGLQIDYKQADGKWQSARTLDFTTSGGILVITLEALLQ